MDKLKIKRTEEEIKNKEYNSVTLEIITEVEF